MLPASFCYSRQHSSVDTIIKREFGTPP